MVSLAGIRGVVGQDLTAAGVLDYGVKFGHFCEKGKVAVGTDTRPSGPALKHAAIAGLLATGCEVVDLGVLPTPSVLISVKDLACKGGMVITASHNPMEWNGLKLINSQGIFLGSEEVKRMGAKEESWAEWHELKEVVEDRGGIERHIEKILSLDFLDLEGLRRRRLKVVIDTCNGAAYLIGPELLRRLGCEVTEMNCRPDPPFPRPPEPKPAGLTELQETLVKLEADIAFATDPDADRLCIVSKSGLPLGEEYTLALCTDLVLSKERGIVVTNVSTSKLVDWIASRYGAEVLRTPIGEAHVVKAMLRHGAVIGGEGNGGVILPRVHPTRDSLTAIALILELLLERERPIEAIIDSYPRSRIVKKTVRVSGDLNRPQLVACFADAELDETDGLLFSYSESWVSIRRSGTEPIVRVIAEAPTEEGASSLVKKAIRTLCAE
jgi:phosphomannomutase